MMFMGDGGRELMACLAFGDDTTGALVLWVGLESVVKDTPYACYKRGYSSYRVPIVSHVAFTAIAP